MRLPRAAADIIAAPGIAARIVAALALLITLLAGCAPDGREVRARAAAIARDAGFHRVDVPAGQFRLVAYVRGKGPLVRVYIEGDGHAWRDRSTPSDDPTPWDPVALTLAAVDSFPAVAYLSRPCQYLPIGESIACGISWWTGRRYDEKIIVAESKALDRLRRTMKARRFELVGFSGGGVVAALLAARRRDVINLRTVAANLDTDAWADSQGVSRLDESLNPADFVRQLAVVPQLHFIGGSDDVVDRSVTQAFVARFPTRACLSVVVVPWMSHDGGWATVWPKLLQQQISCGLTIR